MTTIHELLAEYTTMARDKREKGLLLEKLTRAFLSTDPLWTAKFDDVWLWQDWPDREGKTDTGIDLVAHERFGGGYCAIQCKFFAASHSIQKSDLDSFFTASGKNPFTSRIFVSTADKWSKHADDALINQQIPTTKIGVDEFATSDIDWSAYSLLAGSGAKTATPKVLRPHQQEALDDVEAAFDEHSRGKLIMACGTGKTFTSLRIAEAVAGKGGSVLFLVPSIALLSQSLKEWSAERTMPLRAFAICSDTKVGKETEDYSVSDLAFPATTNTGQLLKEVGQASEPDGLTVYFSTYQSIDVVSKAQDAGLPEFDLVICDEAHRTAGFTRADDTESHFLRIHDEEKIRSKRRLYMTATPKIYAESVRAKATASDATLMSMDDEAVFGPVFHRLGFGEAVERELLTDYRVLVLAVDEGSVGESFQSQFAVHGELNIPDAARIVGIYNGLAKRGVDGLGDSVAERAPLRRAVAFSRSIKDSRQVQGMLDGYDGDTLHPTGVQFTDAEDERTAESSLMLESRHVDGTMNVQIRNGHLEWLKEETDPDENLCRILTNARCLSEGVDVPALDAVIFLNSRDSQVDVVQSVGRVMRKSAGKDYGYIILPVAVPAGKTPEEALNDNAKYKVVWDVLRALRAHDERFEAKIEQIDLNGRADPQLQVIAVGPGKNFDSETGQPADAATGPDGMKAVSVPMDWTVLGADWRAAIYAKIVEKVGERDYWENWAKDVADIAGRHQLRISALVTGSDANLRKEFEAFVGGLQDNLNPSITETDAIEMIAQHLITQPVFDALFEGYEFSKHNPVSQVMQQMVDALEGTNLEAESKDLDAFYANVRRSVQGITDASAKQTTIKRLYEKFFAGAFKNTSERLGIVYTPNEIVDFILHSADQVLRTEFGATISDEGVHVLDPFTGTGTFIVRLLQSGLIKPKDIQRKFRHELHANEIVLLAYYVAAVNIEATYRDVAPASEKKYEAFPGIVLTDTFQSSEDDDKYDDHGIFGDNNERVKAQNALDIRVIIGNPPYSAGQDSANDNNQNLKYPTLDARIAATYAARSTATLKNKLYDSYIRAIRWASDRIKDRGVVAFVSNGGYIDGNTADGLRQGLAEEFSSLYILNLRGNTRNSGEQARREGGKVFGSGSRATIAIAVLVKNPASSDRGRIFYRDIGDYLTREQKLSLVSEYGDISSVIWDEIIPNSHGDWLERRSDHFATFDSLGGRVAGQLSVLGTHGLGVASNRDLWVYNSSAVRLAANIERTITFYNSQLLRFKEAPTQPLDRDATQISWSRGLETRLNRGLEIVYRPEAVIESAYRPFQKQYLYADASILERPGPLAKAFPSGSSNYGFLVTAPGSGHPFSALAVDSVPDLAFWGSGGAQFFPRYSHENRTNALEPQLYVDEPFTRTDNVTDEILAEYRAVYGAEVTKNAVFEYIYGLLHSPQYRLDFAADLKKMLPRIPKLAHSEDFWAFSKAGSELLKLHVGYEKVEPFPLEIDRALNPDLRVEKMRFNGKPGAWDKSTLRYNDSITVRGIPEIAHEYMLGSRSALGWLIERYRTRTDKDSGLVNDPNEWAAEHSDQQYVLDLIGRVVTVSIGTVNIVNSLPPLKLRAAESVAVA